MFNNIFSVAKMILYGGLFPTKAILYAKPLAMLLRLEQAEWHREGGVANDVRSVHNIMKVGNNAKLLSSGENSQDYSLSCDHELTNERDEWAFGI